MNPTNTKYKNTVTNERKSASLMPLSFSFIFNYYVVKSNNNYNI